MAISIDPIFSNIFFTLGLLPHITKKNIGYYTPKSKPSRLPLVTILVPLYREPCEVIENLVSYLTDQTYDHQKLEITFITEPDDIETCKHIEGIITNIKDKFAVVRRITTDGGMKMKPYALNHALSQSNGEIIGMYDAECEPEKEQIEKAISTILEQDYDLVQTKIEVIPGNILGELSLLDTYIWSEVYIPAINEKAKAFPLGTKGLFIKKECLTEIGGFPLHLTEDAMMTIPLASKNKKFGLVESTTRERSVKTWKTHFIQRRRWFRGYLSCLKELIKADIPLKRKFWLSIPYISPITCTLSLVGFTMLFIYFTTWFINLYYPTMMMYEAPWMTNWLYGRYLFYWSLFLGYIGLPLTMFSYLYSIADRPMEKKVFYVHLIPLYWIFTGISAISSFFKDTKNWDKTEREI